MIQRLTIPNVLLSVLLGAHALLGAASAQAEPVYPTGLRVGLEPPPGMSASKTFPGFEDKDRKALITIADMPGQIYNEIEKAVFNKEINKPGITVDKREMFPFNSGVGYLVSFRANVDGNMNHRWILVTTSTIDSLTALITVEVPAGAASSYSDQTVRKALASVTFRPMPVNEQMAVLPFKITDMAGFRPVRIFQRAGVLLTSGPSDDDETQPQVFISVASGGPQQAGDRAAFAQQLLSGTPLREMNITGSEPMRLKTQPGHEIRAEGKNQAGQTLSVVQWVRFGSGGYMRVVGISRKDEWNEAFPRFRIVRDSIDPN
jgi:hypothetical protein